MVRRPDDQPAALADGPQPRAHLVAHLLRRAEGQRVLLVDRAPEAQPVAVAPLQPAGSMQAGWIGFSTSTPISISSGMIG